MTTSDRCDAWLRDQQRARARLDAERAAAATWQLNRAASRLRWWLRMTQRHGRARW